MGAAGVHPGSEAGSPPWLFSVAAAAKAGTLLAIGFTSDGAHPEGTCRVLHLEFDTPGGKTFQPYTQNVPITVFPHSMTLPLAVNDPPGNWKMRGHDLLTGQSLEASFRVG